LVVVVLVPPVLAMPLCALKPALLLLLLRLLLVRWPGAVLTLLALPMVGDAVGAAPTELARVRLPAVTGTKTVMPPPPPP
jgi:hypothetical protein